MPKNLGLYDNDLSIPRKLDLDLLTNELEQLQIGNVGQFLGFIAENVVGAVDAPTTIDVQISSEQPTNQKTGDFWYQII